MATVSAFPKDPIAVLDYAFDWKALTNGTGKSDWLATGETIASHTVTVPTGLTLDSSTATATAVTAWLSGGTAWQSYTVTCRIVTTAGRTDERSITIKVFDR